MSSEHTGGREDISLDVLIQQSGLHVSSRSGVFAQAAPVVLSALLRETLADSVPLAMNIDTEKARSEFIIAPVLAEVRRFSRGSISLFSGINFTADADSEPDGACDFLFSLSPLQLVVQAPILAIVEAENDNIKIGLGQCITNMLAARQFNALHGAKLPNVYGAVTTGRAWKFLRLSGVDVVVDEAEHHIGQLEVILGILVFMVQDAQQQGNRPS